MLSKQNKKRLILLDAHAIIHRAYHALPDFTSSSGEPTGALYGLSAMLIKIIQELKPDYMAACFDLPEPTYRHEVYWEYKAGRAKTDDALAAQLERSKDLFRAFSIPIYEKAGFEADDILGTIVEQLKNKKGIEIIIASGDMDTMQLVKKEKVMVYTLKKGINDTILYDEKAVTERFGFGPKLLPDYKGLRGDPSDNIPGIAGIGEKTATALISEFGTLENLYKIVKKAPDKLKKLGIKDRIINLLIENEEEAEFSKMLGTIRGDAPIIYTIPKEFWSDSLDTNRVLKLFSEFSFRTLSERIKKIFGERNSKESKEKNKPGKDEIKKIAIGLWLLNSDITNPSLEEILQFADTSSFKKASEYILAGIKKEKLEKIYRDIELPLIPIIEEMEKVGIKINSKYLKKLSKDYHSRLSKLEKDIWKLAKEKFNINSPKQLSEILYDKLDISAKNQRRTGTGQKSTRESELGKMSDKHPIIPKILSYRELQKLLSTYIDTLPNAADAEGRIHAKFNQTGTTTGRMSSQNPNLQNIPIKSEDGKKIRNAFMANKGYKLVSLDYSQIELRIAAFLSGDEKLIRVLKRGGDVHNYVAAEVFRVSVDKVDSEMRRRAKIINFGILYGMGANALRANLGVDRESAQKFLNDYFEKFSGLARFLEDTKEFARARGYTVTFFGRRRHLSGINSKLPYVRAQYERMAINAPVQGTSADITKIAMLRASEYLRRKGISGNARLILQVHDELVYEVKDTLVPEVSRKLKDLMENIISKKDTKGIPLLVDAQAGANWGEMSAVKMK